MMYPGAPHAIIVSPGGVGTSQLMDTLNNNDLKINTNSPSNQDGIKHGLPDAVYGKLEALGKLDETLLIVVAYGDPAHALRSLCRRTLNDGTTYLRIHLSNLNVNVTGFTDKQNDAVDNCSMEKLHAAFAADPLQIGEFYRKWVAAAKLQRHTIPVVVVPVEELLTNPQIQHVLNVTFNKVQAYHGKGHTYSEAEIYYADELTLGSYRIPATEAKVFASKMPVEAVAVETFGEETHRFAGGSQLGMKSPEWPKLAPATPPERIIGNLASFSVEKNARNDSFPLDHDCLYFDSSLGEGFGAQYLGVITAYIIGAKSKGVEYCHVPITAVSHGASLDRANALIGLTPGHDCARRCRGYSRHELDTLLKVNRTSVMNGLSMLAVVQDRFNGGSTEAPNTCQFDGGRMNVALHVRRGDVGKDSRRRTAASKFKVVADKVREGIANITDNTAPPPLLHIFTEGNDPELMDLFGGDRDVIFHTDGDPLDTFVCFTKAEYLVCDHSTFSATAKFISKGQVYLNSRKGTVSRHLHTVDECQNQRHKRSCYPMPANWHKWCTERNC
jgi:hypothetical protein